MKGMTFYVDKLEEIYELQKSFTERFFKEKQNLTLEEVRSDKKRNFDCFFLKFMQFSSII